MTSADTAPDPPRSLRTPASGAKGRPDIVAGPARLAPDRRAVSPIVGSVLMLAIATGAVAAILFWGVPLIQESSGRASLDAASEQLLLLDELADTVADSGGGISAETVFTVDRGGLFLEPAGDRWVVTYGVTSGPGAADVSLWGLDDTDADYHVKNEGTGALLDLYVAHDLVTPTGTTPLNGVAVGTLGAGASARVTVADTSPAGIPRDIEETFLRVRMYRFGPSPDTLVAEAWIFDPGAVAYRLPSPGGFFSARLVNGALFVQAPHGRWIEDLDTVQHFESKGGGDPHLFVTLEELRRLDGPPTAGAGSVGLKVRSEVNRVLGPTQKVTDLRINVTGPGGADAEVWQRWIAVNEPAFTAERGADRRGTAAYLAGPVDLSMFYHRLVFPDGFQPR